MRLSPYDQLGFAFCTTNGSACLVLERYDEAVAWLGKARRLNPGYRAASRLLIAALASTGKIEEAHALSQEFMELEPGFTVGDFGTWYAMQEPYLSKLLVGMRLGGLPG